MLNFRGKEPKNREERALEEIMYDINKAIQHAQKRDFCDAIFRLKRAEPLKSHYFAIDKKISITREHFNQSLVATDDEHEKQQIEIKLVELDEIKIYLDENYISDLAVLRAKLIA